ncbi:hypothetical protein [Paraburkholderia unamae]|uniref:Uncharacterized protein n=1 Tax=Paraburkholderia unamae TaxID=219649 RepID=A0ACC6RXB4_9BURK
MSKQLLSKDRIAAGYQRFLAQDPKAMARVEAMTAELADILGADLTELRRDEAAAALGERAAALGIDSFEYLLRFAVETDAERQQVMEARNDALARAIGLK